MSPVSGGRPPGRRGGTRSREPHPSAPEIAPSGARQIREQLERAHELIVDTTGRIPRTFRAPHGYRNPFVGVATRRLGYTVFGWTFGVWDSDPRVSADEIPGARAP